MKKELIYWLKKIRSELTVIDLVFIAFGLFLLISFYFLFSRNIKYIDVRFKVTDQSVLYAETNPGNQYAHSFAVGDYEKDELGRKVAVITGVNRFRVAEKEQVVYVDMNIKTTYNPRKEKYSLRGKDIIFGESFEFNLNHVHFNGLVVDFPGFEEAIDLEKGFAVVDAQIRYDSRQYSDVYGIPSYLSEKIVEGLTAKDNQGEVLAEVLSVDRQKAERTIITDSGQARLTIDPRLEDVFVKLKLTTKKIDNQLYTLDYQPVLVDARVPLHFDKVLFWATITEIIETK